MTAIQRGRSSEKPEGDKQLGESENEAMCEEKNNSLNES